MKTRAPVDTVQAECKKFITHYISNRPLDLPNLDEEDFKKVMNAIVKSMTAAWADGYYSELR